jgi:hypothetical protein
MPGSHWLGNPGGVSLLPRDSFNWLISGDQAPLSALARGQVEADQARTPPESVPQHVPSIFVNAADDCWSLSSPRAPPQPRRTHIAGPASAACSPTLEPLSSPRAPDAILHMLLEARDSALKLGEEAHLFRAHRCRSMQRDTESQFRSELPGPGPGMGDSVSLSSYLTSQQHASGGHLPASFDGPVTREGRDAGGSTAKNMCNQADLDDAGAPCNSLNSFKESLSRPSHGRAGQAPCPQTCGDAQREKGMANYSVCDRDVRAKRRALPQRNWSLECGSRGARP